MTTSDTKRELGKIDYIRAENWRDGTEGKPNTVNVGISFKGSFQTFGGINLTTGGIKEFLRQLTVAFGVTDPAQLVGQEVYALRAFPTFNDTICALESVRTGRRFSLRLFRKSRGYPAPTRLVEERKRLERQVASLREDLRSAQYALANVDRDYTEWEGE